MCRRVNRDAISNEALVQKRQAVKRTLANRLSLSTANANFNLSNAISIFFLLPVRLLFNSPVTRGARVHCGTRLLSYSGTLDSSHQISARHNPRSFELNLGQLGKATALHCTARCTCAIPNNSQIASPSAVPHR